MQPVSLVFCTPPGPFYRELKAQHPDLSSRCGFTYDAACDFQTENEKSQVALLFPFLHCYPEWSKVNGCKTLMKTGACSFWQKQAADLATTLQGKVMERSHDAETPQEVLTKSIKFFNMAGDGNIKKNEFVETLQHYGLWLDDAAYDHLFEHFDPERKGYVSAKKFVDAMFPPGS
ncbi:unnamed protein product [Phaeothamnion confervicola]